jgi:circadian clock protein KaiB
MEPNPSLPGEPAASAAGAAHAGSHYVLRLFLTGTSTLSIRAAVNIRRICEQHLQGRYDLEVVDITRQPTLAEGEQIIAAPTLIKILPLPLRRFIGDMSRTDRILLGLDLHEAAGKPGMGTPAP